MVFDRVLNKPLAYDIKEIVGKLKLALNWSKSSNLPTLYDKISHLKPIVVLYFRWIYFLKIEAE